MSTHLLEVETKYDVAPDIALPDLSRLPGVAEVAGPVTVDLEATYVDTAALDLLALGITLRRRRGGLDEGWHLKLPSEAGRHELREPLTDDVAVPSALREVVAGIVRSAPLIVVAELVTRRRVLALLDPAAQVLAEVCDDRVGGVRHTGPAAVRSTWREWEVELVRGDERLAAAVAVELVRAGATPARHPSKLARVLGEPTLPTVAADHGRKASARAVLAPYLDAEVRRLRQLDPMVRADLPDAVHQMRVTCRRIRAVLACFRDEFEPARARRFRDELGWVVDVLGGERDLEVLRERIGSLVETHDPETAAREAWVDQRLSRRLGDAREAARGAMRSARYDEVLAALADATIWPPWSPRADRRAGPELRRGLRRELARLTSAARHAEHSRGDVRDEALHDVRKAAKRLRYAAEAVAPRFGERAVALAEDMAELQDVLGLHHDEAVARTAVWRFAHERADDRGDGSVVRILRDLDDQKAADVGAYRRVWKRLRAGQARPWPA